MHSIDILLQKEFILHSWMISHIFIKFLFKKTICIHYLVLNYWRYIVLNYRNGDIRQLQISDISKSYIYISRYIAAQHRYKWKLARSVLVLVLIQYLFMACWHSKLSYSLSSSFFNFFFNFLQERKCVFESLSAPSANEKGAWGNFTQSRNSS